MGTVQKTSKKSIGDILQINDADLLKEWLDQPSHLRRFMIEEAEARHEHAQLKRELEVLEAELSIGIRTDPVRFGLKADIKITEGLLEATIKISKSWQDKVDEVNQAQHVLDICRANVSALVDRRRALERRVELLAMDYHAEPKTRSAASSTVVRDAVKNTVRGPLAKKADDPDED